jgi:hypothetical protein
MRSHTRWRQKAKTIPWPVSYNGILFIKPTAKIGQFSAKQKPNFLNWLNLVIKAIRSFETSDIYFTSRQSVIRKQTCTFRKGVGSTNLPVSLHISKVQCYTRVSGYDTANLLNSNHSQPCPTADYSYWRRCIAERRFYYTRRFAGEFRQLVTDRKKCLLFFYTHDVCGVCILVNLHNSQSRTSVNTPTVTRFQALNPVEVCCPVSFRKAPVEVVRTRTAWCMGSIRHALAVHKR